jgi:hypothetical protein
VRGFVLLELSITEDPTSTHENGRKLQHVLELAAMVIS